MLAYYSARQLHKQHSVSLLHKVIGTGEPQDLDSQIRASSLSFYPSGR